MGNEGCKLLKKSLKKAICDEQLKHPSVSVTSRLHKVLFLYNNTPSTATDMTPNARLLRFTPRTLLTALHPVSPGHLSSVRPFKDGDLVLVRFNTQHPVEATIIRQMSAKMYLVDVNGIT